MQKDPPPFRKAAFLLLFARQKVGQKEDDKILANKLRGLFAYALLHAFGLTVHFMRCQSLLFHSSFKFPAFAAPSLRVLSHSTKLSAWIVKSSFDHAKESNNKKD